MLWQSQLTFARSVDFVLIASPILMPSPCLRLPTTFSALSQGERQEGNGRRQTFGDAHPMIANL